MIVNIVHVYVKPEFLNEFIAITKENHEGTIKEPGNLRFDVIQETIDSSKFVLYEAFKSDEAAAEHKKTRHYQKWKDTVADWMARPREGVKHNILFPNDITKW